MPRVIETAKQMTFEEYLEFEKTAEVRHEFVDGFVFAMAGASNAHNLIAGSVFARTYFAATKASCRAYMNDMKLRTPSDKGYYPDVFVTCDPKDFTTDIKTTACFILETLSDSTQDVDRDEKWHNYRAVTSLQTYVLASQKKKFLEVYQKQSDGTWLYEVLDEQGTLSIPCIALQITLEEIYENVNFSQAES
jgi:Uma2 family endonuclease